MHLPFRHEFAACADASSITTAALDHALQVMQASLGNVQLADWTEPEPLKIVSQRGFDEAFLSRFRHVSLFGPSACARALLSRTTVVVEDVLNDDKYAPIRDAALQAGYRSVQSTPLLSSGGAAIGVLSTHGPSPGRPSAGQIETVWAIARSAADAILRLRVLKRIAAPADPLAAGARR